MFETMSEQEFHEVVLPKFHSTWNLHNVAMERHLDLDFFTLLSSVSGVVGQKSQCNYAVGCVFQDAFASYRRSLGLPACSVDLGIIKDVGYIADCNHLAARLDRIT